MGITKQRTNAQGSVQTPQTTHWLRLWVLLITKITINSTIAHLT